MSDANPDLSRRKFVAVSSAVIAAPILGSTIFPESEAADKTYNFVSNKECDLVVLGGGGSGMVAAVRAAQLSGKKVIVLEKDSVTGGGARNATGVAYWGSKWQAKHNEKDTLAEYARQKLDEVYWRLEEKLIYNLLHGTGQFLDWIFELEPSSEELFESRGAMMGGEFPGPEINQQKAGKRAPLFFVDLMKAKCEKYGVEVLTKHPVVDVEVKNGKIVAAIAKGDAGYFRVACKACIMSCGSWINNEAIVKKYYPKFLGKTKYMTSSPHWSLNYTGDGIALAEKVGAFLDYDSFVIRLMGPMFMSTASNTFRTMGSSAYAITVNLDGKRYCSEPISHMGEFDGGIVQCDQPNGLSYGIFDENTLAAALKKQQTGPAGATRGSAAPGGGAPGGGAPGGAAPSGGAQAGGARAGGAGMMMGGPGGRGGSLPNTMEEIQQDIANGVAKNKTSLFKANTLEELADMIAVNKRNFLETVKTYNECCAKGEDREFFKDKDNLVPINRAPYYAVKGILGTDGAFGGVLVNPEIQAYRPDRSLVEGFWVTGDIASGRHIQLGGVKHQVVHDMTWAFASGFLAGTNAAKYLKNL
jgi:fumarate reductase flavoprotein subunit